MEKEIRNKEKAAILDGQKAQERYDDLKAKGLIIYEAMVGSHAYGTNIATSDEDFKFIYIESLDNILDGTASIQINITDDYVGYEIGRFLELLRTQNANIQELLFTDSQFVKQCHPAFKKWIIDNRDRFITKNIAFSYGDYANDQIKKAQGTNKKFLNPMDGPRKSLLDFAWVPYKQGSMSLIAFLEMNHIPQEACGLVAIDHIKHTYHLFVDSFLIKGVNKIHKRYHNWYSKFYRPLFNKTMDANYLHDLKQLFSRFDKLPRKYAGLIDKDGVQPILSSTEKFDVPFCQVHYNLDGFSKYCKDYKDYHDWIKNRNEARFANNLENEHKYDRKNMMHCHRLLDMCIEILKGEGIKVYRPNRDELLQIRNGNSTYQELVTKAKVKYDLIKELYKTTELPEKVDKKISDMLLLNFRKEFYDLQK